MDGASIGVCDGKIVGRVDGLADGETLGIDDVGNIVGRSVEGLSVGEIVSGHWKHCPVASRVATQQVRQHTAQVACEMIGQSR